MAQEASKPTAAPTAPPTAAPKPVFVGGESLADRLLPHLKKIAISAIILAVMLSTYFGYRAYTRGVQADETVKVATINDVALRPVQPTPPAATPDDPTAPATAPPEDPYNPTFATLQERGATVLSELAKQGIEIGHSYKGAFLLDAGKVDEAITEYKAGESADGLEGVLSREGLGVAYESKAALENDATARQSALGSALAAFKAMQPDEDGDRYAFALYHQGRVQQTLGKTAEAKALFEQAKAKAPVDPQNALLRTQLEAALERGQLPPEEFAIRMRATVGLPELVEQRLSALGAS